MSASDANKIRLTFPVGLLHMPASIAPLAGVVGIDKDHRNADHLRFVGNKLAQLEKRPVAVPRPLICALDPRPRTDALEVFQSNRPVRAFGSLNNALRNYVVGIGLKPALFAGNLFQFAACRLRALALQSRPQSSIAGSVFLNLRTGVDVPTTVRSQIDNAEVNSQNAFNILFGWVGDVAGGKQVKLAFVKNKIAFALPKSKVSKLATTSRKRDVNATVHRPDRDRLPVRVPSQNAVVIREGSVRLERPFGLPVKFVGVCDFGNRPNNDLRRKSGLFPDGRVNKFVKVELTEGFIFPGYIADPVTGVIRSFERFFQRLILVVIRVELYFRRQFHRDSIAHKFFFVKYGKGMRVSSAP